MITYLFAGFLCIAWFAFVFYTRPDQNMLIASYLLVGSIAGYLLFPRKNKKPALGGNTFKRSGKLYACPKCGNLGNFRDDMPGAPGQCFKCGFIGDIQQ